MMTGNHEESCTEPHHMREGETTLKPQLNRLLVQARKRRRCSQSELAKLLGVTKETISRWENGVHKPQPYQLRKLCEVFETTQEKLGYPVDSLEQEPTGKDQLFLPQSDEGSHDASVTPSNREPLRDGDDSFQQPSVRQRATMIQQPIVSRRTFAIGVASAVASVAVGTGIYVFLHQSTSIIYRGHIDAVRFVAWSPDGQWIASASWDRTVQVWNASNGSHLFTYTGHTAGVTSAAWSPDSKRIASAGDLTVQVWDARDGGSVFTYRGHSSIVHRATWSSNGQQIASCSYDHTVQVWNAHNGKDMFLFRGHSDRVFGATWSPDGR